MKPGRLMPSERDQTWTNPRRRKAELVDAIDAALRDPDPYDSVEAFSRYTHEDVPALSLDALDDERWRLRTARAFGLLTPWGGDRLVRLDRESQRRRSPGRR
jgi:hypothetical protein